MGVGCVALGGGRRLVSRLATGIHHAPRCTGCVHRTRIPQDRGGDRPQGPGTPHWTTPGAATGKLPWAQARRCHLQAALAQSQALHTRAALELCQALPHPKIGSAALDLQGASPQTPAPGAGHANHRPPTNAIGSPSQ